MLGITRLGSGLGAQPAGGWARSSCPCPQRGFAHRVWHFSGCSAAPWGDFGAAGAYFCRAEKEIP